MGKRYSVRVTVVVNGNLFTFISKVTQPNLWTFSVSITKKHRYGKSILFL